MFQKLRCLLKKCAGWSETWLYHCLNALNRSGSMYRVFNVQYLPELTVSFPYYSPSHFVCSSCANVNIVTASQNSTVLSFSSISQNVDFLCFRLGAFTPARQHVRLSLQWNAAMFPDVIFVTINSGKYSWVALCVSWSWSTSDIR